MSTYPILARKQFLALPGIKGQEVEHTPDEKRKTPDLRALKWK